MTDLSKIKEKANSSQNLYRSFDQFKSDLLLMIENCKKFNPPDTEYVACALKLEVFINNKEKIMQADINALVED